MIKILFIHHGTGIGGAPINLLNIIKQLDQNNYKCKVALIRGGKAEGLFKKNGIEIEVLNASNLYFMHNASGKISWYYFYRYIFIVYQWLKATYIVAPRYLKDQNYDIIHLGSHGLSSWSFAAKKIGFKVIIHNQETVAKGYFGIRQYVLRGLLEYSSDIIINISNANEGRLGLKHKSTVVYNFVSIPEIYRRPFDNQDKVKYILYLGGMAKIKGFETVVGCLQYLLPGIKVQFAGGIGRLNSGPGIIGFVKRILKRTVFRRLYGPLETIEKSDNAEILGMLEEPLIYIDACDILITPFKIEHFSRPAIEAFAYGKPVIGSNAEGMDEIIDHGVNGLLVEKNSPRALAEGINELCRNPERSREMGANGREKAKKMFSAKVNMIKLEEIYKRLSEVGVSNLLQNK